MAKTVVLHAEGEGRALGVAEADRGAGRRPVQQVGAQPLCVGLGDEAALVGGLWQHFSILQHLQLVRGAGGAIDLQLFAGLVDVLQAEPLQNTVEDLGQAEPQLSAHIEAGDPFAVQPGLLQLGPGLVAARHDRHSGTAGRRRRLKGGSRSGGSHQLVLKAGARLLALRFDLALCLVSLPLHLLLRLTQ